MLFFPNTTCIIIKNSGYNMYGEALYKKRIKEPCAVLNAGTNSKKSSVRADSSASKGNALETVADFWLILTNRTKACVDDIVEVHGVLVKINRLVPRYGLDGKHDHTEALCSMWNEKSA